MTTYRIVPCRRVYVGGREEMKRSAYVGSILLLGFGLREAMAQAIPDLPLPNNMTVSMQVPGPDVPPAFAKLAGKWGGYWGGSLASNVIIESVAATGDFRGVYAWGTNEVVPKPGAVRVIGKIAEGKFGWGDPYKGIGFVFTVLPDGTIQGERWDHGVQAGAVVMSKM
jgi:hypothetical protein